MRKGRSQASVLKSGGLAALAIVAALAGAMLISRPMSDLWTLRQREQSPSWRRASTVVMSQRAGRAFERSRLAVAEAVSAPSGGARQAARRTAIAAQQDFSRYMAKAANTSVTHRSEILQLKRRGETVIGQDCAQWMVSKSSPTSYRNSPLSDLLYFKQCTTAVSALQQAIDDQTASLVREMMASDRKTTRMSALQTRATQTGAP